MTFLNGISQILISELILKFEKEVKIDLKEILKTIEFKGFKLSYDILFIEVFYEFSFYFVKIFL